MFESTGVLKTALWRPTVFLELQSSGTTSRLSPKIGPVIGLSVAVGCQLSGGPENHPGERDHFASESEMSPQIGLNGAVGGPRSGGLPEAPEEATVHVTCTHADGSRGTLQARGGSSDGGSRPLLLTNPITTEETAVSRSDESSLCPGSDQWLPCV
ncbi:unnamed protein product [Boreogadus saida]